MGALAKLLSYPEKILATFFLNIVPEIIRLIILSICVVWKNYKLVSLNHKYMSIIDKKSSRIAYTNEARPALSGCSICLIEFAEGDECREVVDCKHAFHGNCLEKWLKGYQATCPLCRSVVVPEVVVAEYHMMQTEQEDDGIEKELALILLNALRSRICNGIF